MTRTVFLLLLRERTASPDWVITRGLFVVMLASCSWALWGHWDASLLLVAQVCWWLSTKWFPRWVEAQTQWDNVEQFFTEEHER